MEEEYTVEQDGIRVTGYGYTTGQARAVAEKALADEQLSREKWNLIFLIIGGLLTGLYNTILRPVVASFAYGCYLLVLPILQYIVRLNKLFMFPFLFCIFVFIASSGPIFLYMEIWETRFMGEVLKFNPFLGRLLHLSLYAFTAVVSYWLPEYVWFNLIGFRMTTATSTLPAHVPWWIPIACAAAALLVRRFKHPMASRLTWSGAPIRRRKN